MTWLLGVDLRRGRLLSDELNDNGTIRGMESQCALAETIAGHEDSYAVFAFDNEQDFWKVMDRQDWELALVLGSPIASYRVLP